MSETSPLYMRMKQAVQWLKQNKQMLQKDIAAKMGISEVAFSNGMKRIQMKFDGDFVIKFHQATDEVFSLDWLMNGTLPKFSDEIPKAQENIQHDHIDQSSLVNALLASKDETIASLNERIALINERVDELKQTVAFLQRIVNTRYGGINDYPFPTGVAEQPIKK